MEIRHGFDDCGVMNKGRGINLPHPGGVKDGIGGAFPPGCRFLFILTVAVVLAAGATNGYAADETDTLGFKEPSLSSIELLGKYIFFDKISVPARMSCATCHEPTTGGTGRNSFVNLHEVAIRGANPFTIGSVKPPTNAYATLIPVFNACGVGGPGVCGGNFWNGRSEGNEVPLGAATEHIGDEVFKNATQKALYSKYLGPVADQALNPFVNPVEQNISRKGVCLHVKTARYAKLFKTVWQEPIDCSASKLDINYKRIAVSLSAWQDSKQVNSFSSKRDIALAKDADGLFPLDDFTAQENLGHDLFYNNFISRRFPSLPITNCSFCHGASPFSDGTDPEERYTDDAYHNIGVPRNPEIPDTGVDSDEGLAGHTLDSGHLGFQKTPTLRNVDKRPHKGFVKAYTHNGWFKSLKSLVHFYNTAAVTGATAASFGITACPENIKTEKEALKHKCWPAPAYSGSAPPIAIPFLLGNLGLTSEQEDALVAYIKTFTDTYTTKPPKPF
jgi:cytochrome c peroxidase